MLFMGLDIGTQGARAVVSDENGFILSSASAVFTRINVSAEPDRYEQNSADWILAAMNALKTCISELRRTGRDPKDIVSVSVDGTSGTIVPLDENFRPLRDAYMYNDMRSKSEAARIRSVLADLEERMGYRFNASFSLPRILNIKEKEPRVYENTRLFAHQADYIVGMLCGEYGITDYSNALKTGYDLINDTWPDKLAELGIDKSKLPSVTAPGAPISVMLGETARELGLSENTVIVGGSTDGYASALAAGAVKAGDWASVIGTTMVLKGVTEKLVIDPSGSSYSHKLPSGTWMLGGASNIGGGCLNHYFDRSEFESMDAAAGKITPTGVLCYPLTGTGERFPFMDPEAREFIVGDVSDRRTLYTALMEGVGYAERLAFAHMAALGCEAGDVIYTAGGAAKSEVWLSIRASILNRQLKVPAAVDAAKGSAILAASEHFGSLEKAAVSMIRFSKTVDPDKEKADIYNDLYGKFFGECARRFRMEDK
jgi:xylulokinase